MSAGCGVSTAPREAGESCDISALVPQIVRYKAGLEGLRFVTRWPDQITTSTFISTTTLYQEIKSTEANLSQDVERTVQTEGYRYEEMQAVGGGTQVKVSFDEFLPLKTLDLFATIISESCISTSLYREEITYKIARKGGSKLPSRSGDELGEISVLPLPADSSAPWSLGAAANLCRAVDLVSGPQADLPICSGGLPFTNN